MLDSDGVQVTIRCYRRFEVARSVECIVSGSIPGARLPLSKRILGLHSRTFKHDIDWEKERTDESRLMFFSCADASGALDNFDI